MPTPFQIGDVVELKSGSPHMTVEGAKEDVVYCVWFDKSEVKRGAFPVSSVKKSGGDWNA